MEMLIIHKEVKNYALYNSNHIWEAHDTKNFQVVSFLLS